MLLLVFRFKFSFIFKCRFLRNLTLQGWGKGFTASLYFSLNRITLLVARYASRQPVIYFGKLSIKHMKKGNAFFSSFPKG
jgi:hypothetical protein